MSGLRLLVCISIRLFALAARMYLHNILGVIRWIFRRRSFILQFPISWASTSLQFYGAFRPEKVARNFNGLLKVDLAIFF